MPDELPNTGELVFHSIYIITLVSKNIFFYIFPPKVRSFIMFKSPPPPLPHIDPKTLNVFLKDPKLNKLSDSQK